MDKLHDATLMSAEIDWDSGLLKLLLIPSRVAAIPKKIIAKDTVKLHLTRDFPWGRSVSINEVILEKNENDQKLIIKMQSGDTVEIIARSITME